MKRGGVDTERTCQKNERASRLAWVESGALNGEAYAAAAGGDRIRVLDSERLAHQIVDEIEFGAFQHFKRNRIDQQGRAIAGHRHVVLGAAPFDVECILEARAAAALDRDAQSRAGLALENLVQSPRRAGADCNPLKRRRDSFV